MAVVREFTLPDLGEGLTEATIVHWMVEVGEVVAIDQPVVEVETAKAMVEVPCPYGGVVTARFGEEGAEVPVGAPLVTVAVGAVPDDLAGDGPGRDRGRPPGRPATVRRIPGPGMCSSGTARVRRRRAAAGSGRGPERAPWRACHGRPDGRRTARPELKRRPRGRPVVQKRLPPGRRPWGQPQPGQPVPVSWTTAAVRWP